MVDVISLLWMVLVFLGLLGVAALIIPLVVGSIWKWGRIRDIIFPLAEHIAEAAGLFLDEITAERDGGAKPTANQAHRQGLMLIGFSVVTGLVVLGLVILMGQMIEFLWHFQSQVDWNRILMKSAE